ncbi:MAG: hypothetical protein ACSHX8_04570 [Opitutaceae bacterium]
MKTRTYLFSFFVALAATLRCAALEAGDVMVVGYISDGTDSVAFVPWVELAAGGTITITDARYEGGGSGADEDSGEGEDGGTYVQANSNLVWTAPAGSSIAPGTVIVVSEGSASTGSVSGTLRLTNNGEQFFLIQGSFNGSNNLIGDLLFGVDYEGSTAWAGGSNESVLPGALTSANAVDFNDTDNCQYTGSRTGEIMETGYRTLVSNPLNWTALAASLDASALDTTAFEEATGEPDYLPGELMFVGWNTNDPDTLSFVSWVDIPNGESFLFFDSEYDGLGDGTGVGIGGGNYASLEIMTWTNNEGVDLPAGTVVVVSGMANGTSTANVGTTTGGFALTNQGEQMFIAHGEFFDDGGNDYFEGDLIFGVDFEGGTSWGESGESKLPSVLNVSGGNLSFGDQSAYEYMGSRNGSPIGDYAALVLNTSNWQVTASALSDEDFVETIIPPVVVPDALGQVSDGLLFHPRRMNNKDAILDTQWMAAQGATGNNTDNLNGPSCVRLPAWLPAIDRADPTAEYYLYFADHSGNYIRMAWAANLEGPWTGYRMDESIYTSRGDRGVLSLGNDDTIDTGGGLTIDDHIASPDVFLDAANNQFVMYYHGKINDTSNQKTVVATSSDGLNFNMPSGGDSRAGQVGHGTRPFFHGDSYFRVFEQESRLFAFSNTGDLFAAPVGGGFLSDPWTKGPSPFINETASRGWDDWSEWDSYGPLRPRHFGVLSRDNIVYAFFTNKAGSPERIKVSTFDFANLPSGDSDSWEGWKGDFPNQELIRPEEDWEGANEDQDISALGGETDPVHQLRDPDIFEDTDGRTYLFYSGAGEQGIGLAQLVSLPVVSGLTEVTTGGDYTFTVATDIDVTPSMRKISKTTPVIVEFGAEDSELEELVYAGNGLAHEQATTVNDGGKSYQLAHDASGQEATLTFPDTYYARPGTTLEFNSQLGVSSDGQFAEFQISFDGTIWQTLWIKRGGSPETLFTQAVVDMDGMEGRVFQMRFRYIHETLRTNSYETGTSSGRGWFIDQIVATGLEKVTDIDELAFTTGSFTLDDITPILDPHLTVEAGGIEDRFLVRVKGLHSGTGFSETTGYGKPFVIRVRDSYEDFLAENFTPDGNGQYPPNSGEHEDPDGDGIVNLVEHSFATDPNAANTLNIGITMTPGAEADPSISFSWNAQAGYGYGLEMSTDLDLGFDPIDYTEVTTPNGDLLDIVLKPDPSLYPLGDRAFFRLSLDIP